MLTATEYLSSLHQATGLWDKKECHVEISHQGTHPSLFVTIRLSQKEPFWTKTVYGIARHMEALETWEQDTLKSLHRIKRSWKRIRGAGPFLIGQGSEVVVTFNPVYELGTGTGEDLYMGKSLVEEKLRAKGYQLLSRRPKMH